MAATTTYIIHQHDLYEVVHVEGCIIDIYIKPDNLGLHASKVDWSELTNELKQKIDDKINLKK